MDTELEVTELEVRDVAPDLWLWRQPHWDWHEGDGWEPQVSSFAVESGGETVLIDPLAPRPSARSLWARLDAPPPTAIVILKPDHVRDVDLFVRWYHVPAHGPWLFLGGEAPDTELAPVRPGETLPGGLLATHDGRGSMETPVYLPEQRAIVFADGITTPGGVLRVWWSHALHERVLPALRAMLELPFEHVLSRTANPSTTGPTSRQRSSASPGPPPSEPDTREPGSATGRTTRISFDGGRLDGCPGSGVDRHVGIARKPVLSIRSMRRRVGMCRFPRHV